MIHARGAPIFQRISLAEGTDQASPVAMRVLEGGLPSSARKHCSYEPRSQAIDRFLHVTPGARRLRRSTDRWQPAVRTFERRIVRWLDPVDLRNRIAEPDRRWSFPFLGRRSADQRSLGVDRRKAGVKAKYGLELLEEPFS